MKKLSTIGLYVEGNMTQEHSKLTITSASSRSTENDYIIEIIISNNDTRTNYSYGGKPRKIWYDSASGILSLYFHDSHIELRSLISQHVKEPVFLELEGRKTTRLEIKLPKIINRIKSASEGSGSVELENWHISQANTLIVEIAYNNTPFYYNPKEDNLSQLRSWGKTIVKSNLKLRDN